MGKQKVSIRAAEPDDHEALRDIYAQPGVYTGTLQLPFPTAQNWRERLSRIGPNQHMLLAVVDERVVGNIGLWVESNPRRAHVGAIGMGVHDDFAGRGIGEALLRAALDLADNWLNLDRIELTVYVDNDRAIRLYERTGFQVEGRHARYAFRGGEMVDTLAMARLRPTDPPPG